METTKPRPSPQGLVSPDDCGLWMKMDANPVTDRTGRPLVMRGEKPLDETEAASPGPAVITRYYSVMDDEGADHDFLPPRPPHTAPVLPAEGSTVAQVNNSSVTLTKGAAEDTQAKDNPSGLDWHPGEKQLMATQNEVDGEIESTEQTSMASMDTASLSKDSILPEDQDQTSMEEACSDPIGGHHQKNTTGDEESNEEPEDIGILSAGQETCREKEARKDNYPKQVPLSNSENETHFDKEGASKEICGPGETDSENADCSDVETNAPAVSSLRASDDDFKSGGLQELCKSDQHTVDRATGQPQVQEVPAGEFNGDEEHVDTRSLNYTLTKYNWVRRESGETQVSRLSISDGDEEMATKDLHGDGGRRISTGIQQGEQLLQRLQLLQLRQDVSMPESPQASQQVVEETRGERLETEVDDLKAREAHLTGADEEELNILHSVESDRARFNLMPIEKNERKDVEAKARRSSSTTSIESERHKIAKAEAGDSDRDHCDGWVPADLSQIDRTNKQNQQGAGSAVNLADNPDVLEIPFKNNISLEPFPTKDGPDQHSDWQFSERKMKKEISQETQRELVLFNQGRIPGDYSKGEVRQLQETKLLFETFQQDIMEGPTRHRKPTLKGRVYPSVLERTRSLEMLSLKMCPVSRAHSFRLYKDTETHAEILSPMSPTRGSRDKTCSSLYAKQDKPAQLYRSMNSRSMDSISTDVSTTAVDTRSETKEGNVAQESPILRGNPFFKLRPALGLKPEVEKDIREAKEREEELYRQRCSLYGENSGEDGERSRFKPMLVPDVMKQSRGKLERIWPPPSKKDQMKTEQTQEPNVPRAGGQRAPLWQRWESGLINGKTSKEKN